MFECDSTIITKSTGAKRLMTDRKVTLHVLSRQAWCGELRDVNADLES